MSTKTDAKPQEQKLEAVILKKPHIHEGVGYKEGAEIKVNEADKAWLIENEIIAAPAAK